MLTVHHLNHSRSQRVLWLLEELELPYEITFYERDPPSGAVFPLCAITSKRRRSSSARRETNRRAG